MGYNKIVLDIFFDKEWFMEQYSDEYNPVDNTEGSEVEENNPDLVTTPGDDVSTTQITDNEEDGEKPIKEEEVVDSGTDTSDIKELEIDGIKYDADKIKEIEKNNSTFETQINELNSELDMARQAVNFYNYLKSNPHIVEAMKSFDNPQVAQEFQSKLPKEPPVEDTKYLQLEEKIQQLELKNTIHELQGKYSDFDEEKVLDYAIQSGTTDLEVAYKALKADSIKEPNMEEIRKQIREELLSELKKENSDTKSLISSKPQQTPQVKEYNLTPEQKRIAIEFGMTDEEYFASMM